ncbi:MAG: hypothetical protein R6V60_12460 [Desulfobacterales bacterium]
MRGKRFFGLRMFILSVLIVGFPTGCGKKGPPVPPRRYRPPAVMDLSHQVKDQTLTLSWSIPDTGGGDAAVPIGCIVYEAKQPTADTDCPDCAASFAPVADLAIRQHPAATTAERTMTYSGVAVQGFIYTYKVACYARDGGLGADSNIVTFEY